MNYTALIFMIVMIAAPSGFAQRLPTVAPYGMDDISRTYIEACGRAFEDPLSGAEYLKEHGFDEIGILTGEQAGNPDINITWLYVNQRGFLRTPGSETITAIEPVQIMISL